MIYLKKNLVTIVLCLIASLAFAYTCSTPANTGDDGGNGGDTPKIPTAPTVVSTTNNGNLGRTLTSITIRGEVTNTGGADITARGVVWGTTADPTIPSTNKTVEDTNTFTSTITSLMAENTYHFRVYATNSVGTSYGANQSFTTLPSTGPLNYVAIWSRGRFDGQLGLGTGNKSVAQLDAACASQEGLTNAVAEGVTDDDSAPSNVINSPSKYTIKAFITVGTSNPFSFHTTGGFTSIADKPLRGPKEWDRDPNTSGRLGSSNADITYAQYFDSSVTLDQSLHSAGVASTATAGTGTNIWRGRATQGHCDVWTVNNGTRSGAISNINHTEQTNMAPYNENKGRFAVFDTSTQVTSISSLITCGQELLTLCIAFDK